MAGEAGPAVAEPPSVATCIITAFDQREKRYHSEPFTIGGNSWRLLVFPKGNAVEFVSIYLDVAGAETLSVGWTRSVSFTLTLLSDVDPKFNVKKGDSDEPCLLPPVPWASRRFPLKPNYFCAQILSISSMLESRTGSLPPQTCWNR